MCALMSFFWTLLLVIGVAVLHSQDLVIQATPCEVVEAWEAMQQGYNSTGNLTDVGYNRTMGGTGGRGGMNDTTARNATVPMPNHTTTPYYPTSTLPSSHADSTFPTKTTAMTLAATILLLAV